MTASQADLARRYGVTIPYPADETAPPPELFPDKPAWILRGTDTGRTLEVMRWGFPHSVPSKRDPSKKIEKSVTNVRNLNSPFWRSALANPARRCLVPFTAFSEYGQQRDQAGKLPLHWFTVPSRAIVSFAGIWRPSETGAVFAFLTTEPNSLVAPIHPKAMPVLLHDDHEQRWLTAPIEEALMLAAPFPAQLMAVD